MRILLLVTHMEPGGAQKAMFELASTLRTRGHDVRCVVMYDKANWIPVFESRYDLGVMDLGMKVPGRPVHSLLGFIRGLVRLWWVLRRERIDVMQTFSHFSNVLGIWVASVARVPLRVSSQRMTLAAAPRWLLFLDRITVNLPLAHRMTAVSEATRRFCLEVEGMRSEKVTVIANGVDPEEFSGSDRSEVRQRLGLSVDSLVVLAVARLHPQKGHIFLLDAVPRVAEVCSSARFLMVGEGDLRQELQVRTLELGVEDRVVWMGARRDVPDLMAAADVVVLPSLWEGMPNVVLEAMAASRAVVATAVDGTQEIVDHGETGLLVPPRDEAALAAALVEILTDPSRRHRMGREGLRKVLDGFSHDQTVDRFEELYRALSGNADA